jgi:HSP90 family molecular chaperone
LSKLVSDGEEEEESRVEEMLQELEEAVSAPEGEVKKEQLIEIPRTAEVLDSHMVKEVETEDIREMKREVKEDKKEEIEKEEVKEERVEESEAKK